MSRRAAKFIRAAAARRPETARRSEREMANEHPTPDSIHASAPQLEGDVRNGSVLIAAITSCTNTSNPSVMLAAGLLAKKAVERGLTVNSTVKSSLAPGSRVVTDYLNKTGLTPYLDQLGFQTVGYGCTTCIGNSGPLHPAIEDAVVKNDLVAASRAFRQPQFRGARASEHQGEFSHVAAARRRVRARGPRGH